MREILRCSYCGGMVVEDASLGYVHQHGGYRVQATPGDYASALHNAQGTRVGAFDVYAVEPRPRRRYVERMVTRERGCRCVVVEPFRRKRHDFAAASWALHRMGAGIPAVIAGW